VESVVVTLELLVVVEKERERVVDSYRREMAAVRIGIEGSSGLNFKRPAAGAASVGLRWLLA
jgi:hypothetical protein